MRLIQVFIKLLLFSVICFIPIAYSNESTLIQSQQSSPPILSTPQNEINKRLWNLNNVDIHRVIDEVATMTGKNFFIDPRVKGKMSIITSIAMTSDEIYQVFLSALESAGFTAVSENNLIKIIPNNESRFAAMAVTNHQQDKQSEEVLVRVIPIKYVSATMLVPSLRPLLPTWAHINAYAPSNQLIIAGRAANLAKIVEIIQRVDVPSYRGIHLIPLHYAEATDIVASLKSLQTRAQTMENPIAIAADEHSNSILLSGSEADRLRLRVIISQLDSPDYLAKNDNMQVIHLHFMPAQQVIPILAGVAKSHFNGIVETHSGESTPAPLLPSTEMTMPNPTPVATPILQTTSSEADNKPKIEIIAEPTTNSVVINAPKSVMRVMQSVIRQLDVRPAQVAVEALIAEINEDQINQLGIDWGTVTQEMSGLAKPGFQPGIGIITEKGFNDFQAILLALASASKADILSTPSLVVLDNHTAHIKVGKEVSVEDTVYPGSANGTSVANPFITVKRLDAALLLNVTPQISADNTIKLNIMHTNNTLQDPNDTSGRPIFNVSEISTSVIVNNGSVLVLGGLIQNGLRDVDRKVPILGDVPLIGEAFHKRSKIHDKKKLMVFLRPRILRNARDNIDLTNKSYNKMRRAEIASLHQRGYRHLEKDQVLPSLSKQKPLKKPVKLTHAHTTPKTKAKKQGQRICRGGPSCR